MGERPDQLCQGCLMPVRLDDAWYSVFRLVYHQRCFNCFKCKRNMTLSDYQQNPLNKLLCKLCPLQSAVRIHQEPPEGPLCYACDVPINKQLKRTKSGNNYCVKCYKCHNCRLAIEGSECFELLDELFCPDCEVPYRNRRYLIAKMGCGPPVKV